MDHGHIIAEGPPNRLVTKHFHDVILQLPKEDVHVSAAALGVELHDAGDYLEIQTADVDGTLQKLMDQRVSLGHLQIRARTLEDLFLELTGKELRA
jgi:ABC-2 type transport system ATP-binding protein